MGACCLKPKSADDDKPIQSFQSLEGKTDVDVAADSRGATAARDGKAAKGAAKKLNKYEMAGGAGEGPPAEDLGGVAAAAPVVFTAGGGPQPTPLVTQGGGSIGPPKQPPKEPPKEEPKPALKAPPPAEPAPETGAAAEAPEPAAPPADAEPAAPEPVPAPDPAPDPPLTNPYTAAAASTTLPPAAAPAEKPKKRMEGEDPDEQEKRAELKKEVRVATAGWGGPASPEAEAGEPIAEDDGVALDGIEMEVVMDMGSESDSPRNSPPGLTPDPSGAATPVAAVDLVVSIDKIPTCPFPDEKWYATEGLCPPRKLQWQFVDKDEELGKLILVSMWTQGGTHTGTHIGFSADARPEGGASLLHFSSREPTGKVVDAQLPLMKPCSSCKLLSYPVAVEEARPCGDDFKTQALSELEAKGHSVYVLPSPKRAGGALIRVIGAELPQTSERWNSEALKSHLTDLDRRVQELRQTLEEGQLCCRVCDLQAGEMEEPCGLIVGLEPKVGREVWPFLVGRMDDGSWEGSKLDWIRREDPLDWDEDEDYEN